jgi:general secretion pathway protein A
MIEPLAADRLKAMVEDYFGFHEMPFGVTPDPRFFFPSPLYQEALRTLVYGIQTKKGILLLTGEVGTGKTILLRKLMRSVGSTVRCFFVSNSHLTSFGLLDLTLQALGAAGGERTRQEMLRELEERLAGELKAGRTFALLIDEAQNLADEALEGLCALSNLETDEEKLLQVVLVGQPELVTRLKKPGLRRIKQRIAVHYQLQALQSLEEVEAYLAHRFEIAGYRGPEIFTKEAVEAIWHYSGGTPRVVNILCDNALEMAFAAQKKKITAYLVMKAAGAVLLERAGEAARTQRFDAAPIKTRAGSRGAAKAEAGAGKRSHRPEPAVEAAGREPVEPREVPANGTATRTVSPQFFDFLAREATEAMGPMAPLVIQDQLASLGCSREAFPQEKLNELIELVSREILNEAMRARFRRTVLQEIDTLKSLRAW